MTLQDVYEEHQPWFKEVGVGCTDARIIAKLAEEVGELCQAYYRRESMEDAVGDVFITLASFCRHFGIYMPDAVADAWAVVRRRDAARVTRGRA